MFDDRDHEKPILHCKTSSPGLGLTITDLVFMVTSRQH